MNEMIYFKKLKEKDDELKILRPQNYSSNTEGEIKTF